MKIINSIQWAVGIAANKSGAALRLGAGITGGVLGTTVGLVGGTVAIGGAVLAGVGATTYAGGCAIMGVGGHVCEASQAVADRAYDDLRAPIPAAPEVAQVGVTQAEVAPEPPLAFSPPAFA